MANPISSAVKEKDRPDAFDPLRGPERAYRIFAKIAFATLLTSCAAYGPYHANTPSEPLKSVRGPADGRYKLAFVEFGDQGSELDTSQRTAALQVIHQADTSAAFRLYSWLAKQREFRRCLPIRALPRHGLAVPRGPRGKG